MYYRHMGKKQQNLAIIKPARYGLAPRIASVFIIILLLASSFSVQAGLSKPITTATGKKIYIADIRQRLHQLLRELGEPRWSTHELNRLSRSVSAYLRAFTGRQYDKTLEALRRGDRYRPMIRAKLAKAGLPRAFEAMPMAESAFRFDARSHAGARGLWQYMPASARHYGLKVGRNIDQRTDPARATDAAVKYLKFLNRKFEKTSVLLTIAAYNAGEGRIARIVRKSGVNNRRRGYSHVLRFLPKETRGYVPEFLAAALILKKPEYFGFPVTRQQPYRFIQVRKPLSIKKIAGLTKLSSKKIKQLNPELKKHQRLPTSNYFLRLPARAAWRLDKKLSSVKYWRPLAKSINFDDSATKTARLNRKIQHKTAKTHRSTALIYQVKRGNHLGGIAKMFDVSIASLKRVNHLQSNRITAGQRLTIPTRKLLSKKRYRVRPGDNLGVIAQRLGVPIKHLKFVNGVTDPRRLRPGQALYYFKS